MGAVPLMCAKTRQRNIGASSTCGRSAAASGTVARVTGGAMRVGATDGGCALRRPFSKRPAHISIATK